MKEKRMERGGSCVSEMVEPFFHLEGIRSRKKENKRKKQLSRTQDMGRKSERGREAKAKASRREINKAAQHRRLLCPKDPRRPIHHHRSRLIIASHPFLSTPLWMVVHQWKELQDSWDLLLIIILRVRPTVRGEKHGAKQTGRDFLFPPCSSSIYIVSTIHCAT